MTKNFKLQTVLNYRQTREDEACQRLAQTCAREEPLLRQLDELHAGLQVLCNQLDNRQRAGIAVAEFVLHTARIQGMDEQIKGIQQELNQLQEEIVARRLALCEASRDKQLLEKLKEKKAAQERQAMNRQETILLDEIALQFSKGVLL